MPRWKVLPALRKDLNLKRYFESCTFFEISSDSYNRQFSKVSFSSKLLRLMPSFLESAAIFFHLVPHSILYYLFFQSGYLNKVRSL